MSLSMSSPENSSWRKKVPVNLHRCALTVIDTAGAPPLLSLVTEFSLTPPVFISLLAMQRHRRKIACYLMYDVTSFRHTLKMGSGELGWASKLGEEND